MAITQKNLDIIDIIYGRKNGCMGVNGNHANSPKQIMTGIFKLK